MTTGINKGKFKLNLPNNRELNEMKPEELDAVLEQTRSAQMAAKANQTKGLSPPAGNLRQFRITIARILTIKRKRGGR